MSIYYKFKAANSFDKLTIDGMHISLTDVKSGIRQKKGLGCENICDLSVINAETDETYQDGGQLIPRNSSLILVRLPVEHRKRRGAKIENMDLLLNDPGNRFCGSTEAERMQLKIEQLFTDLSKFKGTEHDKISLMIAQSAINYHPSRYLKLSKTITTGSVPAGYKCYKCQQMGHWIWNCPVDDSEIRGCRGIPREKLRQVTDPKTPGVMRSLAGEHFVEKKACENVHAMIYPTFVAPPAELLCPLCGVMFKDAVITPCCTEGYCWDCLSTHLLHAEPMTCPACDSKEISLTTLIPNLYLRKLTKKYGRQYVSENPLECSDKQSVRRKTPDLPIRTAPVPTITHGVESHPSEVSIIDSSGSDKLSIVEKEHVKQTTTIHSEDENSNSTELYINNPKTEKCTENADSQRSDRKDSNTCESRVKDKLNKTKKTSDKVNEKPTDKKQHIYSEIVDTWTETASSTVSKVVAYNTDSHQPTNSIRVSGSMRIVEDPLAEFEKYIREKDAILASVAKTQVVVE